MPLILQLFGRLHPLVLHLPVGLLVGLAVLELLALRGRIAVARETLAALAWLAALSAALAASAGYVLSYETAYGGETLENHEKLGIAVAVVSVLAALIHDVNGSSVARLRWYRVCLGLAVLLLLPAAHLGSTLTRGADWLTEPLEEAKRAGAPNATGVPGVTPGAPELSTYRAEIAPIFAARCTSCHGEFKHKGGLRLSEPAAILAGGEDGPVIVPGDPAHSDMIRRLRLPLAEEDHMPPPGKKQPSPEEIARLEAWIAAGAPMEGRVELVSRREEPAPETSPTGATATANAGPRGTGPTASATEPADAPPADPAALAALEAALVHVERTAQTSNQLWIDFAAVAPGIDDASLARLLTPLRAQLAELSLARSAISDASLTLLAGFPHLRKLDLRATAISDAGLHALAGHAALEELVLAQTKLTDAALESLLRLPALKSVALWNSGLSAQALAELRSQRPALRVIAGDEPAAAALEAETELQFTSDRPAPGAAPAAAVSLEPANKTCPVSGNPVKPDYTIIFRGKVIGFCCPNCPKEFWTDPAKYADKLP